MKHIYLVLAIAVVILGYGCSGTQTTSSPSAESGPSPYPGWFDRSGTITADSSAFRGYAVALSGDSSDAVDLAIDQAKADLEAGISAMIEESRMQLSSGSEGSAKIKNAAFILTLRQAEAKSTGLAAVVRGVAIPVNGYKGFRGFAEVQISHSDLNTLMDRELSSYGAEWKALKRSLSW